MLHYWPNSNWVIDVDINDIRNQADILNVNLLALSICDHGVVSSWHKNDTHWRNNVYSVTKSITSLAIGILYENSVLNPFNDSVADLLGEFIPADLSNVWSRVKLYHLMTHTTGFASECLDIDNNDASLWDSNFLSRVLSHPIMYQPGSKMVYCDANYYLLSRIVATCTGEPLQNLVQRTIFKPLGIVGAAWSTCPEGYAIGATGLFLTVEDMNKIGQMLLHGGNFNGTQIVSPKWIHTMTQKRVSTDSIGRDGYGLGYWVRSDTSAFMANGMLGQLIYVSPHTNRVVAWQSCDNSSGISSLTDFLVANDT